MTFASLCVGLIRTALLALPIVAIQFTARDPETATAVSLLWVVQLFKGIGYDIVQHFAGTEANAYLVAILCVKTLPYISIEWDSLSFWVPLLAVELVYMLALRTSYRVEFDEWRFSEEQERQGSSKGHHALISWASVAVLFVVVTGFNAVRVGLFYLAAEPTLDVRYNDIDTLLLWSYAVETVVAGLLVLRVRSLYTPTSVDFWRDVGGVFAIYLYYQLVTLWILPTGALFAVTIGMIAVVIVALVVVDYQVTNTDDGFAEFVLEVVVQWFWELVAIVFSEPMAQVLFLVTCSILAYGGLVTWYVTQTTFPLFIQELTCPITTFINGAYPHFL